MTPPAHESHSSLRIGKYLKDIVYAANDGIVTTFAVIAGVSGAKLSSAVVLIVGLASLVADGFSMGTGNFLGTRSKRDFYARQRAEEEREVREVPETEKQEIRDILAKKGYGGEDLDRMVELVSSNRDFWIEFMMHHELGLESTSEGSAWKNGIVTFIAFVIAGAIPLLPYLFFAADSQFSFLYAAVFSGIALFVVGALRSLFSSRSWVFSGLEMLLVGGAAAAIAFGVGAGVEALV